MTETVIETILLRLGTAMLVMAVLYPVVWCLLRLLPAGPALLHRMAWGGVLLVPLLAFAVPVELPLLPSEESMSTVATLHVESVFPNDTPREIETKKESLVQMEKPATEYGPPGTAKHSSWSRTAFHVLFWTWLCGVTVLLGHRVFRHLKLLRHLRNVRPLDAGAQEQWMEILRRHGVAPFAIPVYLTESVGPALVRSGFRRMLLLPETVWEELPDELRFGVLRHELAHYLHGDNVLSPLFHFFAALQWFQPLAWLALKKHDTAVEWQCDDFAYRNNESGSAELAETFLTIHRSTESLGLYLNTFSRFGTLDRINRLDHYEHFGKEPAMKRILVSVFLVILFGGVPLRPELVAQTAKPKVDEEKVEAKTEKPKRTVRRDPELGPEFDPKRVPKIVKMFPENNATDVDPNISQVYITFDVPMGSGRAWASRQDGTQLDHDEGNPVFWTEDELTSVAPVKLEPNKKYAVYLNIRPFIGFASAAGVPSEAVTYRFETGPGPVDEKRRKELAKNNFVAPEPPQPKRGWGPEQATGKPDTYRFSQGGDYRTAWASETEDGQKEWLDLTWDEPVETETIYIYETFNPGALKKVTTRSDGDEEVPLWEGRDPMPRKPAKGKGIARIPLRKPSRLSNVRLHLDSPSVPGWNEIDAVGLMDTSGKIHWATGATASSTYADVDGKTNRLRRRIDQSVKEEEPEKERNWASDADQQRVREVLRKYKDANSAWFFGLKNDDVESLSYVFHKREDEPEEVSWDDIKKASNWYYEFYRKGISYIGISRLLVIDIDALRCTRVAEDKEKNLLTFDFVLKQPWMNAVGNGISGSWRGWFNGGIGEGTAVIETKNFTLQKIETESYDEIFSDYRELKPGKFAPGRIVVDRHRGNRGGDSDMYFDFRFKVYEPGIWLFDRSVSKDDGKPVAWIDEVKIDGKPAVEKK